MVGRNEASRAGYVLWLTKLADWFTENATQKMKNKSKINALAKKISLDKALTADNLVPNTKAPEQKWGDFLDKILQ